jgi:hypothetical protein
MYFFAIWSSESSLSVQPSGVEISNVRDLPFLPSLPANLNWSFAFATITSSSDRLCLGPVKN